MAGRSASMLLGLAGLLARQWAYALAGVVAGLPFLFSLMLTPRFGLQALVTAWVVAAPA